MGAAYFDHLTDSRLEAALPQLIERALGAGWKVAVRGTEAAAMDDLDRALWTGPEDGFLPHGRAGAAHDALQPVLLCAGEEPVGNGAACLMAVGGAGVAPEDVSRFERLCILFDGLDGDAVAAARAQWKALTGAGCAALYWAQENGRWVKKAESGVSG